MRLKIRTGDQVRLLAGKDRGKSGKVTQVFPAQRRVVVEGLNERSKRLRPRRAAEKGQIVTFWAPVDVSNLALVCPKCGKPTRVAVKVLDGGTRVRACRKCKEVI